MQAKCIRDPSNVGGIVDCLYVEMPREKELSERGKLCRIILQDEGVGSKSMLIF